MAQHRARRTARTYLPVMTRVAVSMGATLLVLVMGHWWHPRALIGFAALPETYLVLAFALMVVVSAVAVRVWTGSEFAAFLAEAALPLAVFTLLIAVLFG